VDEVIAWPDIEAAPLPFGSGTLISFQVGEEVTTGDPFIFITGREFGRVFFAAPPIYLTLPLICAPLGCCAGMGAASAGMGATSLLFRLRFGTAGCDGCLHAPRRTRGAVCRSLFWISYNFP
jgi:hypothetical protein